MLKTRTKTKNSSSRRARAPVNEIMTLAEAANYLRLSEADILKLADEQSFPGRKVGSEWRFLKRAIDAWLSIPKNGRPGIWTAAGMLRDDPYLGEMLEAIEQMRGRPTLEDV